jgi:hypothetical protein
MLTRIRLKVITRLFCLATTVAVFAYIGSATESSFANPLNIRVVCNCGNGGDCAAGTCENGGCVSQPKMQGACMI